MNAEVKTNLSHNRTGILLGYGYSSTDSVNILNCYISGDVTVSQCGHVGGIAGYVSGKISCSYFSGVVRGSAYNSNASIGVESSVDVGGIAGSATIVENSYAEGLVYGSGSDLYDHTTNVGGIAGFSLTVRNCYSNMTISSSGQKTSYAGGIVAFGSNIENCFSVGSISGSSYNSNNVYCGRIIAKSDENDIIINCYADSVQTITKNSTSYGTLQFTYTLQSENFIYNILGWNQDIWQINEGAFPTFK